jgi:predicted nucleotidyltransferase
MDRDQVIGVLRAHERDLRRRGILHAALYGSVARGEVTGASDIDIMIDLDPKAAVDLFEYIEITQYLSDLFTAPVDVANRKQLKALVRTTAERDAVYAF